MTSIEQQEPTGGPSAGPQVTEAAIQRARERALPWIKEGTDRAELSSTQLIQALYSHEHAAVEAAVAFERDRVEGWKASFSSKDANLQEAKLTIASLRAQLAAFGAVHINVVPGERGEGEEASATPESTKAHIDYLHSEWSAAEKRAQEAMTQLAAKTAEAQALRKDLQWRTEIKALTVAKDGNAWFAVRPDFINLQESKAWFGATPAEAIAAALAQTEGTPSSPPSVSVPNTHPQTTLANA